jgi:hypothetical protein
MWKIPFILLLAIAPLEVAFGECQSLFIVSDSIVMGDLSEGDCRVSDVLSGDDQSLVDSFEFQLPDSGRLTIDMEAASLSDPFLRLLSVSLDILAEDDDSGVDFNARISIDLNPGTYFILANSATASENTGSYVLTLAFVDPNSSGGGGGGGGGGVSPPNSAPSIVLIGDAAISIVAGEAYQELGATASDEEDGNLTGNILVSGTVETEVPGIYSVTYSVTDSGGANTLTARVVLVESAGALDTDGDGIIDRDDPDDDNDGINDINELLLGRNPTINEAILLTAIHSLLLL